MNRSSKVISLALIGSAVVLGGFCCIRYGETNPNQTLGTRSYGHGFVYSGRAPGSYTVTGSTSSGATRPSGVSTGVTRTGGFGSTGHAAAGS